MLQIILRMNKAIWLPTEALEFFDLMPLWPLFNPQNVWMLFNYYQNQKYSCNNGDFEQVSPQCVVLWPCRLIQGKRMDRRHCDWESLCDDHMIDVSWSNWNSKFIEESMHSTEKTALHKEFNLHQTQVILQMNNCKGQDVWRMPIWSNKVCINTQTAHSQLAHLQVKLGNCD